MLMPVSKNYFITLPFTTYKLCGCTFSKDNLAFSLQKTTEYRDLKYIWSTGKNFIQRSIRHDAFPRKDVPFRDSVDSFLYIWGQIP